MRTVSKLLAQPLIWIIRLYQIAISPLFAHQCNFFPSCSEYAIESLKFFGLWRGGFYSLKRILKCHPFSKGGYDPVR